MYCLMIKVWFNIKNKFYICKRKFLNCFVNTRVYTRLQNIIKDLPLRFWPLQNVFCLRQHLCHQQLHRSEVNEERSQCITQKNIMFENIGVLKDQAHTTEYFLEHRTTVSQPFICKLTSLRKYSEPELAGILWNTQINLEYFWEISCDFKPSELTYM